MLAPTASLNNLATSSYNSNAAHTPRCRFTSLQLHTTPLTLRANLATMRAPRPAKAETLGSQPSMISNRGWSLSMMISTVLCVQGAGPIRKMTAADRFCRSPVYPGVFRSTDVFTSPPRAAPRRATAPPPASVRASCWNGHTATLTRP